MYDKWLNIKEQIKKLTEQLHDIEGSIWLAANELGQINLQGSKTFENDGYKITITHTDTVSVNQELAAMNPTLFKIKYEFSKTGYKTLAPAEKAKVDEVITIKPVKPGFKVERL